MNIKQNKKCKVKLIFKVFFYIWKSHSYINLANDLSRSPEEIHPIYIVFRMQKFCQIVLSIC